MTEKSNETLITEGATVDAFVKDPIILGAFAKLEESYFREYLASTETTQRETIWAKSKALKGLAHELRAIVDGGKRAAIEVEKKERAEKSRRPIPSTTKV